MTDFVKRITRPERDDWITRCRSDTDFYTFSVGNFVHEYHKNVNVTYQFINRHTHIPYAQVIDEGELRAQLDHARTLMFTGPEISNLRGMAVHGDRMLSEEYLQGRQKSRLSDYELTWGKEQFDLKFPGLWSEGIEWELFALPTINELFVRTVLSSMPEHELKILVVRALNKLYDKLLKIKSRPSIQIVDFGTRRRAMHLWQKMVIEMAMDILGPQFAGTSNVHMAAKYGIEAKGTNSHQVQMVRAALTISDDDLRMTPYDFLRDWGKLYTNPAFRIMLPDTFGTKSFYRFMPKEFKKWLAEEWRGMRFDSGDLHDAANQYIHFLQSQRVNPLERLGMPSDGNTVDSMFRFEDVFESQIARSYTWGTDLMNDLVGCHPRGNEQAEIKGRKLNLTWDQLLAPHSIIVKPILANGRPCVKLSDNLNKATGEKDAIERYARIFGAAGRIEQRVDR